VIGPNFTRSPAQAGAQSRGAAWTPASAGERAGGATSTGSDPKQAALRKAAEAFEAVFLRQVIGAMRQAKLGDDLFGSAATDQFRDLADGKLADNMADQGSFGIADLLLQQFGAVARQATTPAGPANATDQGYGKKVR
jgi:flagellar protein FlgJ